MREGSLPAAWHPSATALNLPPVAYLVAATWRRAVLLAFSTRGPDSESLKMTMSSLPTYVAALELPETVGRAWVLDEFLAPLGITPDSELAGLCEDIIASLLFESDDSFNMRPGGWRIDVAATTAKAALATGLLAGALFISGADHIPAELIPAVVPLLVDVDRVRLSRRDRELLVPLRVASVGIEGMAVSPHVLYNRLDPAVAAQLNYDDFVGFCDHLVAAGEMDDAGFDEIRARPADRPAWIRITWK